MSVKKAATIILILFVISSIFVMISKIIKEDTAYTNINDLPENIDVVYYFHSNYRCETCELVEKNTGDVMQEYYSEELRDGTLIWKVINTDEEGNQHFLDDYELYSGAVVLVKRRNGIELTYKSLELIWELAYDEPEFEKYVSGEIKNFLEGN
ncbi:MAG: hypothetical protein GY863_12025 [bacterium]|nr:hypothetical protein [bacterium]